MEQPGGFIQKATNTRFADV